MEQKCYSCGKMMKEKKINYRYSESGLDNVYLDGVSEFSCPSCGDSFVDIPSPILLNIVLAVGISMKPTKLGGPEIRFMRKEVDMTAKAFAEAIAVDPVTLSRWENDAGDANKTDSHDQLIRYAFKVMMCEKLREMISNLEATIRNNEVVDYKRNRVELNADMIRFIPVPMSLQNNASECTCH